LKELLADWKLLLMIGGGSLAALSLIGFTRSARPAADPEAEERKRRLHLNPDRPNRGGPSGGTRADPPPPVEKRSGLFGALLRALITPAGGRSRDTCHVCRQAILGLPNQSPSHSLHPCRLATGSIS